LNDSIGDLKVENLRVKMAGYGFDLAADFSARAGERLALSGPSGIGKTSFLKILAGLTPLSAGDQGRITLASKDITHRPAHEREIGFVFQEQLLFPALDVLGNVCFGLHVRGVKREEAEAEAMKWLDRVGLQGKARARVGTLSGGERQRAAWVRALIWKPRLLLLDEPFTALDPALKDALRRELLELHRLWPAPLILVSHDERDVETLATARLVVEQTPDESLRKIRFAP
jgi:ABC-type sulfate/molybdate transport systems ATPase subunit